MCLRAGGEWWWDGGEDARGGRRKGPSHELLIPLCSFIYVRTAGALLSLLYVFNARFYLRAVSSSTGSYVRTAHHCQYLRAINHSYLYYHRGGGSSGSQTYHICNTYTATHTHAHTHTHTHTHTLTLTLSLPL